MASRAQATSMLGLEEGLPVRVEGDIHAQEAAQTAGRPCARGFV